MQLSEFGLTSAEMEAAEVCKALATVIPEERIQQAIEASQSQAERQRRLPTELVVALVIGMSVWSQESIVDVLKNLADGWSNQWIRLGQWWRVPSKSAISEARQRVGPQVMSWLFALVARPLAALDTPGAFLNGLRLMVVDGTVFDVPDTEANARVWGYPGSRPGTQAAFALIAPRDAGGGRNALANRCPAVSLPHRRTSPGTETLALGDGRNAIDVG